MSATTFDNAADLYQHVIMDRGRAPHHMHRLEPFDGSAKGDNPMCGDRVEVFARLEGASLAAVSFEARGCEISIASADLMCEAVPGLAVDRVRALAGEVETMARTGHCEACDAILKPLSAVHEFPSRVKCVTLPWRALVAALEGAKEATSE